MSFVPDNTNDRYCQWVLGYLINERWLLQLAMDHNLCEPKPGRHIQSARSRGVSTVIRRLLAHCRIPGADIDTVWVGKNTSMLCWVIPMSYSKAYRTEEESRNFKYFQGLLRSPDSAGRKGAWRINCEPTIWASFEGMIPNSLRDTDAFVKRISSYRMGLARIDGVVTMTLQDTPDDLEDIEQ